MQKKEGGTGQREGLRKEVRPGRDESGGRQNEDGLRAKEVAMKKTDPHVVAWRPIES